MYFYDYIKELSSTKDLVIYFDMDGVLVEYEVGKPSDFFNKRPLNTRLEIIKKLSEIDNVELRILSICHYDSQIKEKNDWLDKYAPFFKKENRIIISKESHDEPKSSKLKSNYLNSLNEERQIILVDDDNVVLKVVQNEVENIIVIQDSSLVD